MHTIEDIHDSRVNGNIEQTNEFIEEYGAADFFKDYKAWLEETCESVHYTMDNFSEVTISYMRYMEKKKPVGVLVEPGFVLAPYDSDVPGKLYYLLIPDSDRKAFLKQLSIGEAEGYESETGKKIMKDIERAEEKKA